MWRNVSTCRRTKFIIFYLGRRFLVFHFLPCFAAPFFAAILLSTACRRGNLIIIWIKHNFPNIHKMHECCVCVCVYVKLLWRIQTKSSTTTYNINITKRTFCRLGRFDGKLNINSTFVSPANNAADANVVADVVEIISFYRSLNSCEKLRHLRNRFNAVSFKTFIHGINSVFAIPYCILYIIIYSMRDSQTLPLFE